MPSQEILVTGVDPMSDRLCVIPQSAVEADLAFIAGLASSTTFGEVRKHPMAWLEVLSQPHYDDDDELVDPEALGENEPFDYGEWFGEDALLHVPLARLRTTELCPAVVFDRYSRRDDAVGFVDYEPAPWLSPDDRDAVEADLVELGYTVRRDDSLIGAYLNV